MKVLGHHLYTAVLAVLAGVLAGEDQLKIAAVIFAWSVGCFHLGRAIPRGASRIEAMAWWMPPVVVAGVIFL